MNDDMPELDFSQARRDRDIPALARILKTNEGEERMTIRLDAEILAWFREELHAA